MKKVFILFSIFFALGSITRAANDINFLRIGETNPTTSAYVFGTGEQLSGQQFQTEGIMTYRGYQYTVYYSRSRNVCIARRKLPLGVWEEVMLPYKNAADDAHNVIAMGICAADGSIHLSYDHHNSTLHYCYSIAGLANDPENMPWKASSFSATTNVMDKAVDNVTYPRFISKPDGNLLFECRYRWSGYGDSYLREYDGNTKTWTRVGRYVQGEDVTPDACAYINGMTYDHLGRLHVTWCWRDDFGGGSNHDFYYAYSEDHGRTWKDNTGTVMGITENMDPVESKTTGTCLGQTKTSLMIESIPYNRGYINQETQAVDSKGRIHAVNSHIPGAGTDSNWGSSRQKARLHHRFRDTDGTWKTVMVKKNGETVNSYCRVNLSFDAFDNAFVLANGAEVYCATSEGDYDNWQLMSDADKGRFISEPLVDRSLLRNEGVLSFVYLGVDNKITVIDYLLDNPNNPSGNGLAMEVFPTEGFVRWSGAFETSYAEQYTLYLTTSSAAIVYVDGVKVLLTRATSQSKEYAFTFAPIASHQHNIVIEAQGMDTNAVSLAWSSTSVAKTAIPATALYAEMKHDIPAKGTAVAPELTQKADLKDLLLDTSTQFTDKKTVSISSFTPTGDYTVEVKAQIVSSLYCGLVFEGRVATGQGFRIALGETSLMWNAPFTTSRLLTAVDNGEEQIYRLVVKDEIVYIYQGAEYITSANLVLIGDVDANGLEVMPTPQKENMSLPWAGVANNGAGKPTAYGWENTISTIAWNDANGNGGVRYMDVTSGHTYNGAAYTGRILTIRWDGSYGTYSYPITLEANTTYEFSMLYEWWNNGTANSISVAVGTTKAEAEALSIKSFPTAGKNVLQKGTMTFTSQEAGTYYLVFNGQSGVMYGIADLEFKKLAYQPKLSLSKYCDESSDIKVVNVKYEDGVFAPVKSAVNIATDDATNDAEVSIFVQNGTLTVNSVCNMENLCISDVLGRTVFNESNAGQTVSSLLSSGIYIIYIVTENGKKIVRKVLMA